MNALFIGRFQPVHNGHLQVLKQISKDYEEIIIGIGSAQYKNTSQNPFSFEERRIMIYQSLVEENITNYQIVAIPDIHDPPNWVDHVCSIVNNFDVVISNNTFNRNLFSEKGFRVATTPYFNRGILSGREIRKRMIKGENWEELVPSSVVQVICKVEGVQRVKQVAT